MVSAVGLTLESHLKNTMTITAGITGAHHALIPNADNDVGPRERITSMIAVAQAIALRKLSPEKWNGEIPAYAQARGIAVRKPGRNRTARMNFVACLCMRA